MHFSFSDKLERKGFKVLSSEIIKHWDISRHCFINSLVHPTNTSLEKWRYCRIKARIKISRWEAPRASELCSYNSPLGDGRRFRHRLRSLWWDWGHVPRWKFVARDTDWFGGRGLHVRLRSWFVWWRTLHGDDLRWALGREALDAGRGDFARDGLTVGKWRLLLNETKR